MIRPYPERSVVLEVYSGISQKDHYSIIAFYKAYERDIELLGGEFHQVLFSDYLNALFVAGFFLDYYKYVDELIEEILVNSEVFDRERYSSLVYRKAISAAEIGKFEEATRVISQYIKLKPDCPKGKEFFTRIERGKVKRNARSLYGLCIALLFALCGVLVIRILFKDAFTIGQIDLLHLLRNGLIFSVALILISIEAFSYSNARYHLHIVSK